MRASKPKRIYAPRIISDHIMVQEDFERLHKFLLETGPRDDAQARADRVARDHDHRGGRARGGSLDAHRALNDRDTGAESAIMF